MKRFFHFFAACALLLTIGVPEVQAADYYYHVKIGDLYYILKGGMAVVIPEDASVVAASNYKGLKEANIPSSVTYYETGNTYVVKAIYSSTFRGAEDLEKVTLPNTMTDIGNSAFENSGLQSITIPGSVTYIGERAFYDTPLYDKSSNWYDGVLYIGNYLITVKGDVKQLIVKEGTRLLAEKASHLPGVAYPDIEYVYLPNTVEYIGTHAFSSCKNLETVVMSNKLKSIGSQAFRNCEKLKSIINLPSTCKLIGGRAFAGCSSLTEVALPENPEYQTVAEGMFEDCTNLTKIVLPKQITRIEEKVFLNCTSLKYIHCYGQPKEMNRSDFAGVDIGKITVYFPERHKAFYEEHWNGFNLVPLRFSEEGIYYELNDTKKTAVVVPERDDADNYKSLSGSILIDKIVIADGEKFTINGMAQGAFKFSKIGRITIDAAMNEIPADAFVYNINLTDAILPKSVTSIGDRAFSGCSSLELVPGLTNDQKDYLPNVDKIGNSAFSGCVKLPKLRLLTETEIGEWAFSGCKGVKDIVLGADVKTIGANAFSECSGLESLTIYSTTQLPFTANMITGVDKGKFVVYVQAKDVAKYKTADGWKEFTIKPIGGEKQYTVIVDVNDSEGGTVTGSGTYYEGETYTLTAIPNEGWHFVRWGNGSTMNPATGTISNDVRTTAFFGKDAKYYDLHVVSADETMGTVSGGGEHIEENTVIEISATPKEGCEFLYWVDSKGVYWGKQTAWKVTQDETLTAHFRVIPDYDEYMVFVLGERVTSANAGDILGDGVWSYDRETHTLRTMKDATYKKENKEFIQDWETGLGALTVVVNHHITAEVETTDKVIRLALYGHNGIKFVGSKFASVNLTALNMIAAQTMKTLEVSNHLRLFITQGNTTDFGKSQFSTSMIFSGTPAIRVNSASLRLSVNLGNKISNQTNDKIELTNAEINYGELDGQYMEILDLTPMYMVNYQTEAAMYLCLVSGMGSFYEGEQVTLYPHPEEGYEFVKWSNGVTDNPYTFTMPAEDVLIDPIVQGKDITPDGAFVNAYAPVGQGTIKDFEGGWYAAGTELSIYAEPFNGWEFVRWDDGNTDNPRIFTVEAGKSMSITAEFEQTPRYTVTFLDWDDEVLKQEKVKEGEDATAPEDPYREGYTFMGWKPADFTDIHSNLTVHAQYEKKEFVFECGDHLFWEIKDGVLTITGYGDMWNWDGIKNYAPWFDYQEEITSVQLPDGLTSIGDGAFYYCISLESITIPAGVTSIGEYAFLVCDALESITIPAGVTSIGTYAFACNALKTINVAAENEHYCDIDGVLFNKSKTILLQYPGGKTEESYTVPDGVTEIGEGAFYLSGVKNIHLPEGVTVIGASAFSDSGLSTIDLPSTLTFIGPGAFNRIPLMTIDIPEGVTSIEEATFAECMLQSIHLPASLTSIGEFAFYSCAHMESIDIPAAVTSIDESAFQNCYGLKSVTCRAPEPPTLGEDVFYLVDCPKTPLYVPLAALDKYKSADQWKEFKIEPMETPIVIAGQKITPDMYNTMISGEGIEGDVFVTENGIFLNKGASIYMSDPSVPAIELTATDKVDKFIISGVDAQIFNSIVISGKAEVQFNGALPDGIEHDGPLSLKLGADVWWNTEHTIELTEGAQVKLILNGLESESQDSLTFYSKSEAIHTPVGASCDIHAGGNVDFFIYNENCPVGYNDRTFTLHNTAMVLPYGGSVTKEGVLDAAGEEMFALRLSSNAPFIQSGKAYPIELCGVTVSEGTADDILGDGKASYDAETNTLSLDGMEVYRSEYQALRVVKSSINVEVKGENEFIEHSIRPAIEVENGDLRIFGDKDAKLHIDNYKSVVIRGDRTGKYRVAFEGCNVSVFASSGYTALEADSLYIDAANVSIGSQYDIAWQSMNPNKNGGLVLKHAVLKEGVVNVSPKMLFEPVPQYKVTFQDKDGNEIETQYVFEGEDAVAPEAPAVEGYTFTGWDKEFDNVTSDLTVKAKYEINHYALTLVAGHGTIAITDESGEHSLNPDMIMHGTIVKLIVTADEGYQFTQWSDGNTDNPRTLVLTQDTSLVAHFEIIYLQPDTVTLCYGETYQWHDKTYDASGVYIDTLSSGVATLHLTILPQVEETIGEATICSGDTYTWQADGKEYAESGTYSVTLQDINGCDSVVILHLTVNPIATTEEHITACDSYEWNGQTYTESGDYTYTTVAANGCDSIVTLHLTINNSEIGATEYATICYSETYTWNGQTYSTEGEYSVTLSNTLGCDSVATLHLTIMPEAVTTTETIVIGSDELPYTWRGNTYSATGRYTVVEQYTTVACDSAIHVLDLTVLSTGNYDEQSVTICETEAPYTWYGESYSATGKYTYTEKYVGTDIDSIQHILNLTVNPTVYTEEHITACDSYEWNGQTYTQSGEYVYTTTAANGCDSIVTLHLTINQSEHVEFSMTACDSYEWHGMTYTISGDYTYNTTTEQGCERVEVLHLTINKSEYVEESVTACDSYEWNSMTYTISGDYTYTTTTDQGCERVEVLHLTILPDATTESEELALCPSELPYEWYGQWLTEAGSYTATEQYAGMECDSVIHELTVNVYVQTLPAAVTLPIVRTGEAIDVTIPTAEIQAHIAAETWYAPNAEVVWYIMENSDWAALTAEPVAAGTTQVVLKYAVATDCGSVESDNMVIDVIPTSVENTHSPSPTSDCQKILYEDHIYILREGKMYNAQGQKVQ